MTFGAILRTRSNSGPRSQEAPAIGSFHKNIPLGLPQKSATTWNFLWANAMAFTLIPVSDPKDIARNPGSAVGNDNYGKCISSFFHPNNAFSLGCRRPPQEYLFSGLPSVPLGNPMGRVATTYVGPANQLSLRL